MITRQLPRERQVFCPPDSSLSAVLYADFPKDRLDVDLNRCLCDLELLSDHLIRRPIDEASQNRSFPS